MDQIHLVYVIQPPVSHNGQLDALGNPHKQGVEVEAFP